MREVNEMDVRLIAHPVDGAWVVDCSEHGLVAVVTDAEVDSLLDSHLREHVLVSS